MHKPLLTLALAISLIGGTSAQAKTFLVIKGAGYGHGVGMSQYGAYGFAKRGSDYRTILRHYYSGTGLSTTGRGRQVRVLLAADRKRVSVTGVDRAGGKKLSPTESYSVTPSGLDQFKLRQGKKHLATFAATSLRVRGPRLTVNGMRYRGSLELRRGTFNGINVINVVSLDSYIRGVVAAEMPSSWPAEALKAQSVAARTYAITSTVDGSGFDLYPDTRSQVYSGIEAETPATDAAVRATAGEIVTYRDEAAITYFFSTSGGRTENVENVFLDSEPKAWLKSVSDPYEDDAPDHRWGPIKLTLRQAKEKLGDLVKGRLRRIEVTKRGISPRVIKAKVIGSKGETETTGGTLKARLELKDTWMYFSVNRPKA